MCLVGRCLNLQPLIVLSFSCILEDVDKVEGHGRTALMYSSMTDQVDALNLLLKKGAIVTAQDNNGQTALHWAAITVSQFTTP